MQFRHDINALRAVAVVAVLLFHFQAPGFRGGFAGVDVFYVISGFLMTQIIRKSMDEGRFSLSRFYAARVRRIVPALAVMVLTALGVGFLVLDPYVYDELAHEALTALLFVSNIEFYRSQNYFDTHAIQKWLLHTWSTSLEWQFYLLYPVALILLRRLGASAKTVVSLMALCAAISLMISIWPPGHAGFAFYMLPARLWEMLTGGLVASASGPALAAVERFRRPLHYAGLTVIMLSVVLLDSAAPWPSWRALGPVAGAAMVLLAGAADERWARFKPVAALGTWSFSIYVWHWPLVVGLAYAQLPWSVPLIAAAMALVVAVSALSYRFIEQPFQVGFKRRPPSRAGMAVIGGAWSTALALAFVVAATDGASSRHGGDPNFVRAARAAATDEAVLQNCRLERRGLTVCHAGPAGTEVLLIGDSHADMIYPHFASRLGKYGSVTTMTQWGCAPLIVPEAEVQPQCLDFAKAVYEASLAKPYRTVVVSAYWLNYFAPETAPNSWIPGDPRQAERRIAYQRALPALAAWMKAMKAAGADVVVLLPFPTHVIDLPAEAVRARFHTGRNPDLSINRRDFERRENQTKALLIQAAEDAGARVIDPVPALCGPSACPTFGPHGNSYYRDSNHLLPRVAVGPRLAFLEQALLAPAATD